MAEENESRVEFPEEYTMRTKTPFGDKTIESINKNNLHLQNQMNISCHKTDNYATLGYKFDSFTEEEEEQNKKYHLADNNLKGNQILETKFTEFYSPNFANLGYVPIKEGFQENLYSPSNSCNANN